MSAQPSFLSERWYKLRPHMIQAAYASSSHRFNVVPSGRRSGKTERFKRRLVRRALSACTPWVPRFFAGAPTRHQAKQIFWSDLKELCRGFLRSVSESEMILELINGAEIHVLGMDKPERVEGPPWDGGGLDEFANCKPTAWTHNIRPALADRGGWFDFIGVPEGRNHYYELAIAAQTQMAAHGPASQWGFFTWPSSDILPAEEIEAARRDLDELTFNQEFEASFVNFEGRAYYSFHRDANCAPLKYDPDKPLVLCFDFNVDPGICAVIQEQELPRQFERDLGPDGKPGAFRLDRAGRPIPLVGTGVIGEVHIPRNSNTPAVCRRIVKDWGAHRGQVFAYGDATGGARGSAKVVGSDWDLIKAELRGCFGERFTARVKSANPPERARINAVNSRVCSGAGEMRLMVDPIKAPNVVKDFEGVVLLKGGSGEIDKRANLALTHFTDGIGYYVEHDFPVVRPYSGVTSLRIHG